MSTINIRGKSQWCYETGASVNFGYGVSVEKGMYLLDDPKRNKVHFDYHTAGAGPSLGLRGRWFGAVGVKLAAILTKFTRGASAGGSTAAMFSRGDIFVLESCPNSELTRNDLRGIFFCGSVFGGMFEGGQASVILAGMGGASAYQPLDDNVLPAIRCGAALSKPQPR